MSKWAAPLWLGAALAVGFGAWKMYQGSKQADSSWQGPPKPIEPVRAAPAWREQAAAVAIQFPGDPELWQEAARLLMSVEPGRAQELLRMAAAVKPASPSIRADQADAAAMRPGELGAASAWQTRAFWLQDVSPGQALVQAVVEPTEPDAGAAEAKLGQACSNTPDRAAAFVGWLMIQNRSPEGLAWINRLSPAVASSARIRELKIELLCRMGVFDEVRGLLLPGDGAALQSDPIDLALCACLAREQGRDELGHGLWTAAVEACEHNLRPLEVLLRLGFYVGVDRPMAENFEFALNRLSPDSEASREWAVWKGLHRPATGLPTGDAK